MNNLSDLVPSLIRTWVPILVGAAISVAAAKGLSVSEQTQAALVTVLTAVITGLYYSVVRVAEQKWPKLGWLLGSPAKPRYSEPETPATPPAA